MLFKDPADHHTGKSKEVGGFFPLQHCTFLHGILVFPAPLRLRSALP